MIQLTLTLKMTTVQVVKTSVTVNNNSPIIQDYVHPDDQTQPFFLLMSSLILYIYFIMWASFRCQNIIFEFLFTHYRWSNSRKTSWGIIHCMSSLMSTLVTLWPQIQTGLIFKYELFID